MCIIITYGFTIDGTLASGTTCSADTSQTIGAEVQVKFDDASEVGKTVVGNVKVLIDGVSKGIKKSAEYIVPYINALAILNIPFTGITNQIGTYTFRDGCSYVNDPDLLTQYCYKCTSTRCTTLTMVSAPVCTQPSCTMTIV